MSPPLVRLLHRLDPETAHRLALMGCRFGLASSHEPKPDPILAQQLWGLDFRHPVGLAAGFDKSAEAAVPLLKLGFAFVEVGSVTPQPQAGNPRPRLFRLADDQAAINRMGFNNDGLEAVGRRLQAIRAKSGVIGANIGANKDSAERVGDYEVGMAALAGVCDYIAVNVSSPNTPGLRDLQAGEQLDDLLARVLVARQAAQSQVPVLLKLAPDLAEEDLAEVAAVALKRQIDGAILTNTTIAGRDRLHGPHVREPGGLSGAPLFELSTRVLADFYHLTKGRLPLIGVGGIDSVETAYAKIRAGASLVQLYTGFVYKGPGLIGEICDGLAERLRADGFGHISEAVGAG